MIIRIRSRAVFVDELLLDGVRQTTGDDNSHCDRKMNVTLFRSV